MIRTKIFTFGLLALIILSPNFSLAKQNDDIVILWADSFSKAEKIKLTKWLVSTFKACEKVLGKYTFDYSLIVHRRENANEPVPWAHTSRLKVQSVHFYVNPEFSLKEFLDDWTAVHEISHLSIPFLGTEQKWFAEGYATYAQNLILLDMGIYDKLRYDKKYKYKLNNARPYFKKDESYIYVLKSLGNNSMYSEMYYGGACFFLELDRKFRSEFGNSFLFYIKKYQECCRQGFSTLDEFIFEIDKLTKSKIASNFLKELNKKQLIF